MDLWRSKIMLVLCLRWFSIALCLGLFWVSSKIRRRCLLRLNAKRSQIYNGKHTLCFATAVMKYRLTYSVNKYPTSELSAMLHRDIWSQWANLVVAGQGTTDAGNKGSPRSHQQTISSAFLLWTRAYQNKDWDQSDTSAEYIIAVCSCSTQTLNIQTY